MQQIALLNDGAGRGHHQHIVTLEAGADDIGAVEDRHVLNRHIVQVGVIDPDVDSFDRHMAVGERGFVILRLFVDVNAKQDAYQPHGKQNAANPKRVGHGVAHPHLVDDAGFDAQIAQDLLPGAERRRVGNRPGENAQHHGKRDIEDFVQNCGDQPAHYHNAEGKQVEPQSRDPK